MEKQKMTMKDILTNIIFFSALPFVFMYGFRAFDWLTNIHVIERGLTYLLYGAALFVLRRLAIRKYGEELYRKESFLKRVVIIVSYPIQLLLGLSMLYGFIFIVVIVAGLFMWIFVYHGRSFL